MKRIFYLILIFAPCFIHTAAAQNVRDYIRHGNRMYRDSIYDKSQVQYQKGFEKDSSGVEINYNLGNSFLRQGQPKEAMRLYEKVSKVEHDKARRHMIFHNMGVILQSQKQFGPAIEAYKEALRCDPSDHESRYNLVLCQRQLKNEQQPQGGDQDDKNGDKNDKDQQKQDQQQKQQKKDDKQEQKQQQQEQQMSKENAEQMLNAAMQDERQTQDKVKKQLQQAQPRRLQKQW
ncbi:MAG: tetratricopeptide repeat protein [Bacteroidaceae bacterium]|nr:tetratricopeptide repeat protein [Bacteroidaceae bacterium]